MDGWRWQEGGEDPPEDPLWGLFSCHQVVAFLQVGVWPGTAGNQRAKTSVPHVLPVVMPSYLIVFDSVILYCIV